jgi:hypothetical protein
MMVIALICFAAFVAAHGFSISKCLTSSKLRKSSLSMLIIEQEVASIMTPTGPMKTTILRPSNPGKYPGIVFYSEIFQVKFVFSI